MEHFAPHKKAAFEGWYSKFDLPSGAKIALVICCVPNATTLPPYMLSVTYYPSSGSPIFQREHWVSAIERIESGPGHAFELRVAGIGSMQVKADSTTIYNLRSDEWSLQAETNTRTPWDADMETPEGWLVRLPLPLHWHVHSLASSTSFTLQIPSLSLSEYEQSGRAMVHQEKNWANSFPEAHIWIQAFDHDNKHGVCLAGGKILGMQAFILGHRSPQRNVDLLPPFALSILGTSPFLSHAIDFDNRSVVLEASNLSHKVTVRASAPRDGGWFGLGAPFPEGHRENFCSESFRAVVEVTVFERRAWWDWWGWRQARRDRYDNASLEFAGGYFPMKGSKRE